MTNGTMSPLSNQYMNPRMQNKSRPKCLRIATSTAPKSNAAPQHGRSKSVWHFMVTNTPGASVSGYGTAVLTLTAILALTAPQARATGDCDDNSRLTGSTTGSFSFACGLNNTASSYRSSAVGHENNASGVSSSVLGHENNASIAYSTAVGYQNTSDFRGTALGNQNTSGYSGTAVGATNTAGHNGTAVGTQNTSSNTGSSAVGYFNTATNYGSNAIGISNTANGKFSSAMGANVRVLGNSNYSIAFGSGNHIFDAVTVQDASAAIAIGHQVKINIGANNSVAIGTGTTVGSGITGAVALGQNASATENNTISVGSSGNEKRIVNVAVGTTATDAATYGQLTGGSVAASFQSLNANNGGITNAGVVSGVTLLNASGTVSAATLLGNTITTTSTATIGGTLSAQGANFNNQIVSGVAAGVNASDAVNKGQLDTAILTTSGEAAIAQATANTARTEAAAAQTTADTARTEAATAQSTAASAQTTANTARTEAATAQTTANTARTEAATAQTTADGALLHLQAAVNQLLQSGVCSMQGGTVRCASSVQLGGATLATGADNAVAIGNGAEVHSSGGIALGQGATAIRSNSVAIGAGAKALSSVAVGTGAQAIGTNTTAVGDDAVASGHYAAAFGNRAQATHDDAVALGNGSITTAANTVSIGAPGAERRITHLADPINASDAANKNYVDLLTAASVSQARQYTEHLYSQARRLAARGVASAMANTPQIDLDTGETGIGVGVGHYDGESAIGIALGHVTRSGTQLNLGLGYAGDSRPALRAGMGWKW